VIPQNEELPEVRNCQSVCSVRPLQKGRGLREKCWNIEKALHFERVQIAGSGEETFGKFKKERRET
jgi:hypothetical protein